MAADYDRFRSFAERYIITRGPHFRLGFEREDAWTAIMDATQIYKSIEQQGRVIDPPDPTPSHIYGAATAGPPSSVGIASAQKAARNILTPAQAAQVFHPHANTGLASQVVHSKSWTGR